MSIGCSSHSSGPTHQMGSPVNVVSFKGGAVLGRFPGLYWFTSVLKSPLPSPELPL